MKKTSNPHFEQNGKAVRKLTLCTPTLRLYLWFINLLEQISCNIDSMDLECLEVTVWDCSCTGLKRSDYVGTNQYFSLSSLFLVITKST